jgi:aerobic C4-dicarboxylate transport protein
MTSPPRQESAHRKPWYRILYVQVLIAVFLGIVLGYLNPGLGKSLKPLGDGFINLVKMIIAPIIFCTVVHGIASMSDVKKLGRIAIKALVYFEELSWFDWRLLETERDMLEFVRGMIALRRRHASLMHNALKRT